MNFYYEICQTKKLHLNSEPNDQSGFWIKISFIFVSDKLNNKSNKSYFVVISTINMLSVLCKNKSKL